MDRFLARPDDQPAITIIVWRCHGIGNVGIFHEITLELEFRSRLFPVRRIYSTGRFLFLQWEKLVRDVDGFIILEVYTLSAKSFESVINALGKGQLTILKS